MPLAQASVLSRQDSRSAPRKEPQPLQIAPDSRGSPEAPQGASPPALPQAVGQRHRRPHLQLSLQRPARLIPQYPQPQLPQGKRPHGAQSALMESCNRIWGTAPALGPGRALAPVHAAGEAASAAGEAASAAESAPHRSSMPRRLCWKEPCGLRAASPHPSPNPRFRASPHRQPTSAHPTGRPRRKQHHRTHRPQAHAVSPPLRRQTLSVLLVSRWGTRESPMNLCHAGVASGAFSKFSSLRRWRRTPHK
mmetsp:Transcript_13952/g.32749  ORF Transcript_13952/g.32749 Transcript_13952/m.32749 type:complete len:250 (+) Transcript_13952:502-1251(+)